MYSKEEFDKEKTKVLKYILYKKRSEYEKEYFKEDKYWFAVSSYDGFHDSM